MFLSRLIKHFDCNNYCVQPKYLSFLNHCLKVKPTLIKSIKPFIISRKYKTLVNTTNFMSEHNNNKVMSEHIYTNDTPVILLEANNAFTKLSKREQLYAHYLSKASLFGSLIVLFQTSSESPLIFTLFRRIFKAQAIEELKEIAQSVANFSDEEWRALLVYLAAFLSNMGNYRGFGDTKFIPNLPKDKLEKFIRNTKAYETNTTDIKFIWDNISEKLYSLDSNQLSLGFPPKGTTTYFSDNCTEDDSMIVKQFMENNKIEAYNTRAFKDERNTYEIRFASSLSLNDAQENDFLQSRTATIGNYKFSLTRGDYSQILSIVNKYLEKAQTNASNENEVKMIENYVSHFRNGNLNLHKDGSRYWIKDKGPIVESYIGFIETYRDPSGMRAEFEGFVAMVNKEMSKKFNTLVEEATKFLPLLPWWKSFEKDVFLKPDFTSLDVLTFAGSGIPAGINIPNYDEIRQNEGFKNVSLGNVISASYKEPKPNYLSAEDAKLSEKYAVGAFEVQIGLHELLGHGSGKLFKFENESYNFDIQNTINPLTNLKIDKWYKSGETYDSKFGALGSPYEECRAECVGIYLCLNDSVLKVFGFSGEDSNNIIYVNWLSMVHKGIESLKMYMPENKKWLQAHSQARYVITRVLLEASTQFVKVDYIDKSPQDGKPDLLVTMTKDIELIRTVGKKAIEDFLLKLQIYKSLGDIESAQKLFNNYSEVKDNLEYPYLKYRDIVLARKKPRKLFVQSSSNILNDNAVLKSYDATHEGLILSFLDHIDDESDNVNDIDNIIVNLWKKDAKHF